MNKVIVFENVKNDQTSFYQELFEDKEFVYYFWGQKPFGYLDWLQRVKDTSVRYFLYQESSSLDSPFGMIHFQRLEPRENTIHRNADVFIYGGILSRFFNSGMGIWGLVGALRIYFRDNPSHIIYASTFGYNNRSARMLSGIGFTKLDVDTYAKNHFILNKEHFENCKLTQHLLSRITIIEK